MPDEEVKETKLRMLKASEGEVKDLRKNVSCISDVIVNRRR